MKRVRRWADSKNDPLDRETELSLTGFIHLDATHFVNEHYEADLVNIFACTYFASVSLKTPALHKLVTGYIALLSVPTAAGWVRHKGFPELIDYVLKNV